MTLRIITDFSIKFTMYRVLWSIVEHDKTPHTSMHRDRKHHIRNFLYKTHLL